VIDGASGEALDRASWGSQEEYHLKVSRCPARPEPASLMNHLQSPRCNTRTRLSSEWSEESEAVFREAVVPFAYSQPSYRVAVLIVIVGLVCVTIGALYLCASSTCDP